jgi:pyruvate-formate lyase-activating enzyme
MNRRLKQPLFISGLSATLSVVVAEVLAYLKVLDIKTVLLMGVEPTLDPELPSLARTLHKEIGSFNILMTNGVKAVDLENIDLVLFSLKAYDEKLHKDYTGRSNKKILENFTKFYNSGKKLQAISLVIPDYIDAAEIERISEFIASIDDDIPLTLHAYFAVPDSPWRSATGNDVAAAVKLSRKHLNNVPYRTLELERVGQPAVRIV